MISMRIHSVIDVITNSSTEIYSYVDGNAVNAAYDMLDAVIKHSGGTQSARDLFTVSVVYDDYDRFVEHILDNEDEEVVAEYPRLFELEGKGWSVRKTLGEADEYHILRNTIELRLRTDKDFFNKYGGHCEGISSNVEIVAKDNDNSVSKAVEKFLNCFHSEEYYN